MPLVASVPLRFSVTVREAVYPSPELILIEPVGAVVSRTIESEKVAIFPAQSQTCKSTCLVPSPESKEKDFDATKVSHELQVTRPSRESLSLLIPEVTSVRFRYSVTLGDVVQLAPLLNEMDPAGATVSRIGFTETEPLSTPLEFLLLITNVFAPSTARFTVTDHVVELFDATFSTPLTRIEVLASFVPEITSVV